MKSIQRMIVSLVVLMALVIVGCGDKDQLQQIQTDREQLTKDVSATTEKLVAQVEEMKKENLKLRFAIENQDKMLEEVSRQVRNLQDAAGVQAQKIESEKSSKGSNMGGLITIVIVILVILIAVFLAVRLFRAKPLEDEDEDDFSSFDDDYGFDDEEEDFGFDDEEDAEDKEKKDNPKE